MSCTFRQTNIIWTLYAYVTSQLIYLRYRRPGPDSQVQNKLHDPPADQARIGTSLLQFLLFRCLAQNSIQSIYTNPCCLCLASCQTFYLILYLTPWSWLYLLPLWLGMEALCLVSSSSSVGEFWANDVFQGTSLITFPFCMYPSFTTFSPFRPHLAGLFWSVELTGFLVCCGRYGFAHLALRCKSWVDSEKTYSPVLLLKPLVDHCGNSGCNAYYCQPLHVRATSPSISYTNANIHRSQDTPSFLTVR